MKPGLDLPIIHTGLIERDIIEAFVQDKDIVNVSAKFQQVFLYGVMLFIFNVIFGIFSLSKALQSSSEHSGAGSKKYLYCCKCLLGMLSLSQIVYALVVRYSPEGSVCSGDYFSKQKLPNGIIT